MLKIAIIGLGHLGKIHLKCIQIVEGLELVGFYDTDPNTTKEIVQKYNIHAFDSVEALIAATDIVDIVTPTTTHFDLAKQAIQQGKHLFVEKPLTTTAEEAKELCALLEGTAIKAQVGHVERFNPAFLAVNEQPIDPMFMEVHRLAMFNPRGTDVSVVLDLMIHDLDLILKLIPHEVRSVEASGVAIVSPTADICNARISFENGAVVNITASRISMKNMRKFRVFQPNAYLSMDFLKKKTEIVRLHESDVNAEANLMELDTPSGKRYIEIAMPEIQSNNAIKMELESLAKSIETDSPVKVSFEDGHRALQLAYQIIEAMEAHESFVRKARESQKI